MWHFQRSDVLGEGLTEGGAGGGCVCWSSVNGYRPAIRGPGPVQDILDGVMRRECGGLICDALGRRRDERRAVGQGRRGPRAAAAVNGGKGVVLRDGGLQRLEEGRAGPAEASVDGLHRRKNLRRRGRATARS